MKKKHFPAHLFFISIETLTNWLVLITAHGSRRSVERAKTGDILKAKIQQRPPRQELERRHILEADALHADPSLAERQRMLKKARLADQLNDQLSHRPGPLELIQKNILHTEEPIEQAVKTGQIPYKATSEGALKRPQHPNNYINPEEDSQGSSEGDGSPASSDVLETAAKSAGIVVSLIQPVTLNKDSNSGDVVFADLCRPLLSSPGGVSSTSTLSPLSSVASPQPSTPVPPPPPPLPLSARKCDAPGKDKNKKKSKKSTPKARTIKFHEYKGPPSAQKNSHNSATLPNGESSYDLLLQQQTLLLQFQLQLQHKFPKIILPGPPQKAPSPPEQSTPTCTNLNVQQPSPSPSTSSESSVPSQRKLEDMKVSDLKAELKKRSLPVSGCKPQLIERLKSHQTTDNPGSVESEAEPDSSPPPMEIGEPLSPAQQQQQEDLVREQQRQIQELQRELTLSQLKLQALNSTRSESQNTQLLLQKHLQARQQQQNIALQVKQLQAETKVNNDAAMQQKLQQQHVAFQNLKNRNNEANKLGFLVNNAGDLQVYQLMQCKSPPQIVLAADVKEEKPSQQIKIEYRDVSETPKPPPLYAEKKKSTVKSQIVDDVLEILIKNGELPPSAASYPSTPGSANQTKPEPPYFPNKWEPNPVDLDNNIQMLQEGSDPSALLGVDPTELLNSLDNLDFNQLVMDLTDNNNQEPSTVVPMDTDEWLEALMPPSNSQEGPGGDLGLSYDPMLGLGQETFDPFNLEEFRPPPDIALPWDKVDYAT